MNKISTIEAKVRRSKTKLVETVLWREANEQIQQFFLDKVGNEDGVLCFYESNSRNFLLTTQSLIIGDSLKIGLGEINRVFFKELENQSHSKHSLDVLTIYTQNGETELPVEKGTWHLIYSVLNFTIGLFKKSQYHH